MIPVFAVAVSILGIIFLIGIAIGIIYAVHAFRSILNSPKASPLQ